jgi:hypothetical protein
MTTTAKPANSQAYPTHLTPAQRMAKVLRVNPQTNWCAPSGLFGQAKEIRQEIAKAKGGL